MLPPNFEAKAFVKELCSTYFVVSILLGVVIGVVTSLIVNATLVEISINAFFSLVTSISGTPPLIFEPSTTV